jgi:hypothetical protein
MNKTPAVRYFGPRAIRLQRRGDSARDDGHARRSFAVPTLWCIATFVFTGCSSGPEQSMFSAMSTGSLGTGSLGTGSRVAAPHNDVYVRVARGANRCWFGPKGELRQSHVFYGETVSALQKGAGGQIVVHERLPDAEQPWGARAFRVAMVPVGSETDVESEVLRIDQQVGDRMKTDVMRWANGSIACAEPPVAPAVTPPPVAPLRPGSAAQAAARATAAPK